MKSSSLNVRSQGEHTEESQKICLLVLAVYEPKLFGHCDMRPSFETLILHCTYRYYVEATTCISSVCSVA